MHSGKTKALISNAKFIGNYPRGRVSQEAPRLRPEGKVLWLLKWTLCEHAFIYFAQSQMIFFSTWRSGTRRQDNLSLAEPEIPVIGDLWTRTSNTGQEQHGHFCSGRGTFSNPPSAFQIMSLQSPLFKHQKDFLCIWYSTIVKKPHLNASTDTFRIM